MHSHHKETPEDVIRELRRKVGRLESQILRLKKEEELRALRAEEEFQESLTQTFDAYAQHVGECAGAYNEGWMARIVWEQEQEKLKRMDDLTGCGV